MAAPPIAPDINDQRPYEHVERLKDGEAMTKNAERRLRALFAERDKFVPVWREITNYIAPNRGLYDNEEPNQGKRRDYYVLDSIANRALGLLQSGIQGGLTSPSLDWFRLAVGDAALNKDVSVRQWLDDCREIMMDEFARSNIYNCLFGAYGEVGAFGVGAMLLEDDARSGRLQGKLFTAGQYAAAFEASGLPSAFAYSLHMTAEQIRDRFGVDKLDDAVLTALQMRRYDQTFEVYHLIQEDFGGSDRVTQFPYLSVYWRPGKETALSIGGFHEFPAMVPRWETIGNDSYGYGPGWNALGDAKMLQEMYRDYLIAEKMRVRPPVFGSTEARNVRVNLNPGGVTYADGDASLKPVYTVTPDINGQMQAIMITEQKVREAFFADLFLLNTSERQKNMTAYEVEQRQREKLQMLGPVLERLDNELLDPLVGRAFNILERAGKLPPPPEALVGVTVTIEYVSPLAIAQKSSSTASLTALLQLVAGLAQIDPGVVDTIDPDKVITEYMRMTGVPAAVIRPDDEVAAVRQQRAQAQAQAQQQEMMAGMADVVQKGAGAAKDLAAAPMGGGSMLDGLLGNATTDQGGEAMV